MPSDQCIGYPYKWSLLRFALSKVLFPGLGLVERSVQVMPFGANTTATNPANPTRDTSPRLACGRVDSKRASRCSWQWDDDFSPIPYSTKRIS
jgi:hypothetical protein